MATVVTKLKANESAEAPRWLGFVRASPRAWARVIVLFIGLCLVKLAMLVTSAKYLSEIHWRVTVRPEPDWTSWLAFVSLGLVGTAIIWVFGTRLEAPGRGVVRHANGLLLVLGIGFIFLTFHEGEKNYIHPVMTGILRWSDLLAYLSLDFFFRPPFLAAWIFIYVLKYYFLVRTGREHRVIRVTAIFAAVYWFTCLRELAWMRQEMLVCLLVGTASLAALLWRGTRFRAVWLAPAVLWTALGLMLLFIPGIAYLVEPYFLILAPSCLVIFLGMTAWVYLRGYTDSWLRIVPFLLVSFLLFTNSNYPGAQTFNNAIGFALQLPHYFFGALSICVALSIAVAIWGKSKLFRQLWWLDLIVLLLIVAAVLDFRLFKVMGIRAQWDVLSFGDSPKMVWKLAKPYLPLILGIMAAWVAIQVTAVRAISFALRRLGERGHSPKASPGFIWVTCLVLLAGGVGLVLVPKDGLVGETSLNFVKSSPVWARTFNKPIARDEFFAQVDSLGIRFSRMLKSARAADHPKLNVLLVLLESASNEHLSLFSGEVETQPLLSRYRERMELFPNVFSNFAGSIHARFAVFTGLYPVKDFSRFTQHRIPVKSIFEVFKEQNYEVSMFYSSYLDYTGFRSFLAGRGIDRLYDADTMPGSGRLERIAWGLQEDETAAAIRAQLRQYRAEGTRFFLTYVPAAPHYPYDKVPDQFREFELTELNDYRPAFLNQLLYMDWILAGIIEELDQLNLSKDTLVVITSDHGEMLGGKGNPIGHGWRVTPELANVPLIIMNPTRPGYKVNTTVGSQLDLLPTIVEMAGWNLPSEEYYQGESLYTLSAESRTIYLNSYQEYAIVESTNFWRGSREARDAAGLTSCFGFSNQDARTTFTAVVSPIEMDRRADRIGQFDRLQASFLANYEYYRRSGASRLDVSRAAGYK